jgi:hypothetical protein
MNCNLILGLATDAPTIAPTVLSPSNIPSDVPTESPTVTMTPTANVTVALPEIQFVAWTPKNPLGMCSGDCDSDAECKSGLKCYERSGDKPETYLVPGCGDPSGVDLSVDICYNASLVTDKST